VSSWEDEKEQVDEFDNVLGPGQSKRDKRDIVCVMYQQIYLNSYINLASYLFGSPQCSLSSFTLIFAHASHV